MVYREAAAQARRGAASAHGLHAFMHGFVSVRGFSSAHGFAFMQARMHALALVLACAHLNTLVWQRATLMRARMRARVTVTERLVACLGLKA
eukprot:223029-Chlamydomonas_euryale.AAC.1